MEIVINTRYCPCRTLKDECGISGEECYEDDICSTCPLIGNGGVKLPIGHGDLVDADAILEDPIGDTYKDLEVAEVIIPADTESEEE